MDGLHFFSFGVGVLLGWLVLPMLLNMMRGRAS